MKPAFINESEWKELSGIQREQLAKNKVVNRIGVIGRAL